MGEFGNKIHPSSKDQKAAKQIKRKVRKINMTTTKGAFTWFQYLEYQFKYNDMTTNVLWRLSIKVNMT